MPRSRHHRGILIGGAPAISVSPSSWDYGDTPVGTPTDKEFLVIGNVTITAINLPAGFSHDAILPWVVIAGVDDTFNVTADADDDGAFSGDMEIISNGNPSSTLIPVTVFVAYFLDKFNGGSWPAGSGTRTSDIGELTVIDSAASLALGSGKISHNAAVGFQNPAFYDAATRSRTKGLAALLRNFNISARALVRWTESARINSLISAEIGGNNSVSINGENIPSVLGTVNGSAYDVLLVMDTNGAYVYLRAAGEGDYKLKWRDNQGTTTPLRLEYAAISGAGNREMDELIIMLDSNDILINPSQNVASPVSGETYSGTPSAIIEMTLAVVTMSDACGFKFRVADANNYWYAYFDAAGAFKVDRIINGSPDGGSPYVNVAGVQANGGTRRIRVRADGSSLDFYTKSAAGAGTWTKRGGTISDLLLSAYSDIIPVAGATYTISNLQSDRLFDAAITALVESWQP